MASRADEDERYAILSMNESLANVLMALRAIRAAGRAVRR